MRNKTLTVAVETINKLKRNLDQMTKDQKVRYKTKIEETYADITILLIGVIFAYYAPVICKINSLADIPAEKKEELRSDVIHVQFLEKRDALALVEQSIDSGGTIRNFEEWENKMLVRRENLLAKL